MVFICKKPKVVAGPDYGPLPPPPSSIPAHVHAHIPPWIHFLTPYPYMNPCMKRTHPTHDCEVGNHSTQVRRVKSQFFLKPTLLLYDPARKQATWAPEASLPSAGLYRKAP